MTRDAFDRVESIVAGQPPTAKDWEWFASGLRQWTRGENLEAALSLTYADRVRRRDSAMRAAAELLMSGCELSAWDLAGRLADRLKRFKSTKLPLFRRGATVHMDEVERHLLVACESGARISTSRRHLHRLLA